MAKFLGLAMCKIVKVLRIFSIKGSSQNFKYFLIFTKKLLRGEGEEAENFWKKKVIAYIM